MRRGIHLPLAVLASAACLAGAVGTAETAKRCWRPDDVAYAVMTQRICELNWALFQFGIPGYPPPSWNATAKVLGCWNLMAYNTNKYLSSGVYQSSVDNRCVLVFSGFHGALTGYLKAMAALINPPERWSMCKNQLYAPFVKVLRAHTALKNWTRIVDFIAGPKSTCAGGTATLLGESVGGSLAEIFATCSATGDLAQVQPKALPRVQVKAKRACGGGFRRPGERSSRSAAWPLALAQSTINGNLFYFNKIFWLWDYVNVDKDSRLDVKEFSRLMSIAGVRMKKAEVQQEFRKVDTNGGGYILFDEFCQYFTAKRCPECFRDLLD